MAKTNSPAVKVKLLTSVARRENGRVRSYPVGSIYECSPEEAERMIDHQRAESLEPIRTPPATKTKDAE